MSKNMLFYLRISENCCNFAAKLIKKIEMAKFSRKKMQNFSTFYLKLKKRAKKTAFRDEVMALLGWKYSTFYYKMSSGNIYVREADRLQSVIDKYSEDKSGTPPVCKSE